MKQLRFITKPARCTICRTSTSPRDVRAAGGLPRPPACWSSPSYWAIDFTIKRNPGLELAEALQQRGEV